MNRDYLAGRSGVIGGRELVRQAAFHEAGHAAAIYLRNQYQNLPEIHFQIALKGIKASLQSLGQREVSGDRGCRAKLEGGLLLESSILVARNLSSMQSVLPYRLACEADVVNLMAGPLAEAKYVALRDGELFNQLIVNYDALKNYGGKSDQEKIEGYLEGFRLPPDLRDEKLRELHSASFQFVNQTRHWRAISQLADYIVESEREIIACEEAMAVMDAAMRIGNGSGYAEQVSVGRYR